MTKLLVTSGELKSNDTRMAERGKIAAILIADVNVISGALLQWFSCFNEMLPIILGSKVGGGSEVRKSKVNYLP